MTKIRRFFLPNVTAPFTTVPLQASLFKFAQKKDDIPKHTVFFCAGIHNETMPSGTK